MDSLEMRPGQVIPPLLGWGPRAQNSKHSTQNDIAFYKMCDTVFHDIFWKSIRNKTYH